MADDKKTHLPATTTNYPPPVPVPAQQPQTIKVEVALKKRRSRAEPQHHPQGHYLPPYHPLMLPHYPAPSADNDKLRWGMIKAYIIAGLAILALLAILAISLLVAYGLRVTVGAQEEDKGESAYVGKYSSPESDPTLQAIKKLEEDKLRLEEERAKQAQIAEAEFKRKQAELVAQQEQYQTEQKALQSNSLTRIDNAIARLQGLKQTAKQIVYDMRGVLPPSPQGLHPQAYTFLMQKYQALLAYGPKLSSQCDVGIQALSKLRPLIYTEQGRAEAAEKVRNAELEIDAEQRQVEQVQTIISTARGQQIQSALQRFHSSR